MSLKVAIRGSGVAACASVALLERAGISVTWTPCQRPGLPAVMLGESTQRLIRDIFPTAQLDGLVPVRRRQTLWDIAEVRDLPHAAIVASEAALLDGISDAGQASAPRDEPADWTITTSSPAGEATEHVFGNRTASIFPISLRESAPSATCWVEALEKGWLFVLPTGDRQARLLAVGDLAGDGLSESKLVAAHVDSVHGPGAAFASYPRLVEPLCGPAWLSCGSGALRFDPVCGEGVGHALREAILATAVIRASAAGVQPEHLLSHYRARLVAGFARHLETCVQFYTAGRKGPWWDEQITSLCDGLRWCRQELAQAPPPAFRLNGFDLEPI